MKSPEQNSQSHYLSCLHQKQFSVDFDSNVDFLFYFSSILQTMNIVYIPISILWSTCIVANSIVIITFFTTNSLRNNHSYWYPIALAILDLILGSTAIPLQVLTTEQVIPLNDLTCDIFNSYQTIFGTMEIFVLLGMAINRYNVVSNSRANNDQRRAIIKYFIFTTIISTTSIVFLMGIKPEYDWTYSSCFFLKRDIELPAWVKYAFIIIYFAQYAVMGYFNVRVIMILQQYNTILNERIKTHFRKNGLNNNGELLELSCDRGKVSIAEITVLNQNPTIHDIRRGKTVKEWILESKKQRRLLTMIIALEFTCFLTILPAAFGYFAMNQTSCQICRDSVILRNLAPWAYYLNQVVDPLMLLLTNKSFRRGARTILRKYSSSPNRLNVIWSNTIIYM